MTLHPAYAEFLENKSVRAPARGLKTMPKLAEHLFPFQRHCVEFALRVGASGQFISTGLGKTACQLEWAQHAAEASNGRALILTPLAVAKQIEKEGRRWGYDIRVIRDASDARSGINVCNYDRLGKLDPDDFGAVSLDEASAMKGYERATTQTLMEMFPRCAWKLCASATPAPNDLTEMGSYAEFLSIRTKLEMLSRWFVNDTADTGNWRLKGHAANAYWDWMSSWARMADMPSDLGDFDDTPFILPPLNVVRHRARQTHIEGGDGLFAALAMSATTMHDVKRQTSEARADKARQLIDAEPDEPWILWCDTDYEADALKRAIPDAVDVRGSLSIEEKEARIEAFSDGSALRIIGKPVQLGMGLNWQHCARQAFVGRGYSYERFYQAVRRCWRFGQKRQVDVHLIVAEGEDEIGRVIDQKADGHAKMRSAMRSAMLRNQGAVVSAKINYEPKHKGRLPTWL